MSDTFERPLWRIFPESALRRAARHAREGGFAVVEKRAWTLLARGGKTDRDELPPLVEWAVAAVEADHWMYESSGELEGLVRIPVAAGWREAVREWAARDRKLGGATQTTSLDCTLCSSCCHANVVRMRKKDLARFVDAGRHDLVARTERRNGLLVLPLAGEARACIHLDAGRCGIYELRPSMCSEFLAGSEHCLTSREERYGGGGLSGPGISFPRAG